MGLFVFSQRQRSVLIDSLSIVDIYIHLLPAFTWLKSIDICVQGRNDVYVPLPRNTNARNAFALL